MKGGQSTTYTPFVNIFLSSTAQCGIKARESLAIGMVNKVVPHEELMPSTYNMAERIAKNAPIPIAFVKRGLQNFYKMDLPQALDYEAYALEVCRKSDDFMESFK